MGIFTGTGVALVTPFNEDYAVDESSLRNLVDYVIGNNVDFLVALGTTAEAATMSAEERAEAVQIILDQNNGRVPVMVGMGGNNTTEVLRGLKDFPGLSSCDGILSVTPYYNKPSQEGLYRHFKAVAEQAPLPVFLYNVPGRTGINMTADTVIRLSHDCPNIMGIKEASGNFEQATAILKGKRNDFILLSGDDALTLPLMSIGAEGVIAVIANVMPADFSEMVKLAQNGDFKTASQIHIAVSELCRALFAEGNPAGIKAALHLRGIIKHNILRLPLTEVTQELYRRIKGLC